MEGDPRNRKVSLLKKYDIPVDHLSYEYVEKCSNKKELERLIRILRSGEEGSYPDLLKATEEKLRSIAPESRILHVETPVLTKECLPEEEWIAVENELLSWEKEMNVMDKSLDFEKGRVNSVGCKNMPDVRKVVEVPPKVKNDKIKITENKSNRIKSGDYSSWDKYDVDKELLKLDVEEERQQEENEKKKRQIKKLEKENKVEIPVLDKDNYSSMEQQVLANQAKDRGNESYKAGDYESALKYYDISIKFYATASVYNNRAMTYLKLKQYENAIKDCNKVLQLEKNNVKALYRRASAYLNLPIEKNKNCNYDELALEDLQEIILLDPNNKAAQADLQKLKKKLNIENTGKKFRMLISEEPNLKEVARWSDKCSFSGNYMPSDSLPLTYYGPSTSFFRCEPNSALHRALSGSFSNQILCKCNSNRPKQNPLCMKCGEAMCKPKPVKVSKTPSEPKVKSETKQSSEHLEIKNNIKTEVSNQSQVSKADCLQPKAILNKICDNSNAVNKPISAKVVDEPNTKELTNEKDNKKEAEVLREVLTEMKDANNEVLKKVDAVSNKNNGALQPENGSSQVDVVRSSKKNKNKKNKSKDGREKKALEPVKVVHAAKYLHPTSIEPKVKKEVSKEPQQDSSPSLSNSTHFKAFVPNRKCYSNECNKPDFSPAASSKIISNDEGNKENILENNCSTDGGAEEKKMEIVESAYEFMKTWEELKKFDESYSKRADILRRIKPSDLSKVIGIKLDSDMLSCLLECLLRHLVESDPSRVIELLKQLPQVPRFGLVSMFLEDSDKKKMKKLIETAEGKGFKLDEDVKKSLAAFS